MNFGVAASYARLTPSTSGLLCVYRRPHLKKNIREDSPSGSNGSDEGDRNPHPSTGPRRQKKDCAEPSSSPISGTGNCWLQPALNTRTCQTIPS